MCKRNGAVRHHHIAHFAAKLGWKFLTHHGSRSGSYHLRDKLVGIDCHTAHCHKEATGRGGTRVAHHVGNRAVGIAGHRFHLNAGDKIL